VDTSVGIADAMLPNNNNNNNNDDNNKTHGIVIMAQPLRKFTQFTE